jgi:branched-chain amino acid transport system permease protein
VSLWVQIVLSGLAAGSVYGLIGIGHTLVHRLIGIVHFALGDLVGLGVFLTLLVTAGRGPVTQATAATGRFALGLVAALVVTTAIGVASYLVVIHPYLLRGSTMGWVAGSVAVAFAIQAFLAALFGRPAYVFPDSIPFHKVGSNGIVTVAGASFQVRSLFVIALGVALAWGMSVTITRTRFGRGLQAVAEDVTGAHVVGVPVDAYVSLAFGLVGAVAVVIAVAAAPSGPFSITAGTILGVKGLVVAVLVRFSTPWAAFAAGLGLGVVESAIASGTVFGEGLGPAYREVLPLAAVLLVLALRERARRPGVEAEVG